MAIKEWTYPIHEEQKGEPPRAKHYLQYFYKFNGTIKEFAKLLKYAWQKKHDPTMPKPCPKFDDILEDQPINFYISDEDKGAPTENQLRHWSKGSYVKCDEKHSWDERRTSKRNEIGRLAEENIAEKIAENLPYVYKEVVKGFDEINEAVTNSKLQGKFNPTQAEYATRGRSHIVDDLQKLSGKDKDFNVKADVDSKNVVQYQGVNNLLEAFYVSKAEWDKRKQSKQ